MEVYAVLSVSSVDLTDHEDAADLSAVFSFAKTDSPSMLVDGGLAESRVLEAVVPDVDWKGVVSVKVLSGGDEVASGEADAALSAAGAEVEVFLKNEPGMEHYIFGSSLAAGSITLRVDVEKRVIRAGYTPASFAYKATKNAYARATGIPTVRPILLRTEKALCWALDRTGLTTLLAPEVKAASPEDPADPEDTTPSGEGKDAPTPLELLDGRIAELLVDADVLIDRGIAHGRIHLGNILELAGENPYVKLAQEVTRPVGKRLPVVYKLYEEEAEAVPPALDAVLVAQFEEDKGLAESAAAPTSVAADIYDALASSPPAAVVAATTPPPRLERRKSFSNSLKRMLSSPMSGKKDGVKQEKKKKRKKKVKNGARA